ncbi:MAG: hypothetical protein RR248_05805 [Clostridia bacterium]
MSLFSVILIMFCVALSADVLLYVVKRSNFFCPISQSTTLSGQKCPSTRKNGSFHLVFLFFVLLGFASLFISVNYIEVSNFVKSYLSDIQIQLVRDIIASLTNGSTTAIFFQSLISQILVALSVSLIVCAVDLFRRLFCIIIQHKVHINKDIKTNFQPTLVSRINLQFSRFNQ